MLRQLAIYVLLIMTSGVVLGQNVRFSAATDASVSDASKREYQVLQNSVFEISFTLENSQGTTFTPPSFGGLQVISGPSSSTQVSIINGRRSEKKSYGYNVMGVNPGTFRIGPATIKTAQGTLSSDPFTVVVTKANPADVSEKKTNVEAVASDTTAYLGQQIIVKYQLLTQENIKSYEAITDFDFDGFFVRQLDDVSRRPQRIIRDGQEYFSTILEAVALFPQQTGTYTIPSVAIRVGVPKPSRRRSLFSFQEYDYRVINTQPLKIEVLDLPPGAPASFSGAVGKYEASFEVDKKTLSTDQTLNLKLGIRGDGDTKYIIPPAMNLGDKFEVYDPNILRDESYISGSEVINYKVFEYLIVPKEQGAYTINPEFSYFNVDSNKYFTVYPPSPFRLRVTQGQQIAADLTSINNRNLRPYKPASELTERNWGFMGSTTHLSMLSLLFLGIIGMMSHQYLLKKDANLDPALKARRKARKVAIKRLATARQYLDTGNERSFYDELSKTILNYLEDKLNIRTGSLTRDNLTTVLTEKGCPEAALNNITDLLKNTELALFAGGSSADMQVMYDKAQSIIEEMEAPVDKR
jgi:hypothetical protein